MPLTPSNGDKHAAPLIRLYRLLELALWRILAKLLGLERGWGRRWLMRMMMRLPNFRRAVRRTVDDTAVQAPDMVATAINRAWRDGTRAARSDTGSRTEHFDDNAVRDIIDSVLDGLGTAHRGVLVDTENIYRRVINEAARDPNVTNDRELHTLLREALQRNARFGFVATTDQRGRRRELVAYAEQQIRGGVTRAEVDGFCAQALADGNDLFIVSDVPGACRLCTPFEGRVISITGATIGAITRNTNTGRPVPVNVMCSLAEARARGLFHYGCRHTIKVWTPEDPTPPAAVRASERQRTVRRAATANARRARAQARMSHAGISGPQRRKASGGSGEGSAPNQPAIPPSVYDDAATPTEVAQRLAARFGVDVVGFDSPGVDLEVAREYARAIDAMLTRFPYVDLQSVRIGKDRLGEPVYARTWPAQRPDGSLIINPDGSITTEEINLNIDFATNPTGFAADVAADVATGFHCANSHLRPTYTTIVHEFGHVLDNQGGQAAQVGAGPEMFDYWDDHHGDPNDDIMVRYQKHGVWLQLLSGYSFLSTEPPKQHVNWVEALAEAFEDVETNGDNASEAAKAICAILINLSRGGQP